MNNANANANANNNDVNNGVNDANDVNASDVNDDFKINWHATIDCRVPCECCKEQCYLCDEQRNECYCIKSTCEHCDNSFSVIHHPAYRTNRHIDNKSSDYHKYEWLEFEKCETCQGTGTCQDCNDQGYCIYCWCDCRGKHQCVCSACVRKNEYEPCPGCSTREATREEVKCGNRKGDCIKCHNHSPHVTVKKCTACNGLGGYRKLVLDYQLREFSLLFINDDGDQMVFDKTCDYYISEYNDYLIKPAGAPFSELVKITLRETCLVLRLNDIKHYVYQWLLPNLTGDNLALEIYEFYNDYFDQNKKYTYSIDD